ncbi:MAG TPA: hypothetical protein VGY66_10850 [Gemmataceae bacterium]|jgi:hypothetical protein|nr:hypothetical protein [Gemmataceae bacterium]
MTPATRPPDLLEGQRDKPAIAQLFANWQAKADGNSRKPAESRAKSRRILERSIRRALLWGFLFFAGVQVALAIAMEERYPELRDPEYGYKLAELRCRLAEAPDRPLFLAMGSSRTLNGFAPSLLANPVRPVPAVLFNFGLTAAGPLRELLCTQRLLEQGIRPRWLVIEIMPPFLSINNFWKVEKNDAYGRLSWADLQWLRPYANDPWAVYPEWLGGRALACWSQRFCILNRCAPDWCPRASAINGFLRGVDGSGWLANAVHQVDADQFARGLAEARLEYPEPLMGSFHVAAEPDRALHELLALCRRENIIPLLLIMPEGSIFQSWYLAQTKTCLQQYLARLAMEYDVPVVDARAWVPDSGFMDSHHLTLDGAAVFSARFERSVLRPLVEGRRPTADLIEYPSMPKTRPAQTRTPCP